MSGLSLVCGDCQLQLRSVKEAQDHAEISGHSNFIESKEAVLNLVCSQCGKPCRSKTETDLHTKRTGHSEFSDKTSEASKPLDLTIQTSEAVKAGGASAAVSESTAGGDGTAEMVVPSVNKELQSELEGMGFSAARSVRALHFSGAETLEAAINWIVDHEDDVDIDEMPLVAANAAPKKQPLSAEEAQAKAQELVERARKKKLEEEKLREREREKERIRIGKELLEAKRLEEQAERKRLIELKRREKEDDQRARERIRSKLAEDKAERRRKLGLPPEESPAAGEPVKAAPPPTEEKKPMLPIRPASKAERMRDCLRRLKQAHKDEDARVKLAFQTLLKFVANTAQSPNEEKFRRIRLTNPTIQERVGSMEGAVEFLQMCGFEKEEGGEFLVLPLAKHDPVLLNTAGSELNSAILNPFFGVL